MGIRPNQGTHEVGAERQWAKTLSPWVQPCLEPPVTFTNKPLFLLKPL